MDRRSFLHSMGAIGLGLSCPQHSSCQSKPNVLVFFTDDQRASSIHALGNPHIHTPNIDQLVKRGTSFTRTYMMGGMTGATCIPSRAMLHTGKHLFHLRNMGREYSSEDQTLAEVLRSAGYHTYFTGKRHSLTREKLAAGFDDGGVVMGFAGYYTDKRRMPLHDWDPEGQYTQQNRFVVSGTSRERVAAPERNEIKQIKQIEPGPYSTELYIEPAVNHIRQYQGDQPWFMYVSLSAPHDPHEAPESIRELYNPNTIPLPDNFKTEHPFDNGDLDVRDEKLLSKPRDPKEVKQRIADYYSSISFVDQQFGRIVTALEESGQIDNTIIIFAGDSGLAVGQHGLLGKQNLYDDAGVRVPFIMAGPSIPKNEVRDSLVSTCDIYPTICELTDTSTPSHVDGKSIIPILRDKSSQIRDSIYLGYREFQRGIVEQQFKLIEYVPVKKKIQGNTQTVGSRHTQLFDIKNDPWENNNLAALPAYTGELQRLRQKLLQARIIHNDGTDQGHLLYPEMHDQYLLFWNNYSH